MDTVNTENGLRSYLRTLARRRDSGVVTADDAHTYLTRQGLSERNIGIRLSMINRVLREPNFYPVGLTASRRPAARYRQIAEWQFNG